MDRRLILPFALILGCAQGSLEGPMTFGVPQTATNPNPSDTGDDDDDDDSGDETGTTGDNSGTQASSADAEESSTSSPASGQQEESSDDAASVDASAEGESSSSDPSAASASASMSEDDSASASASDSNDDGVDPPPEVGPWEDCQAATCEGGTDCITVNGVDGEPYCAPQCVTDDDCPFADSGDATPFCLLVGEGEMEPTNCALICEVDGLDYGTCPNGMSCTSVPGQDPSVSLCMW